MSLTRQRLPLLAGCLLACILIAVAARPAPAGAAQIRPRIINGDQLTLPRYQQRWSFMVALVDADRPNPTQGQFCGGTLIHPRIVLTAAHCVTDFDDLRCVTGNPVAYPVITSSALTTRILAGSPDLSAPAFPSQLRVWKVTPHPSYDPCVLHNDIALLTLTAEPAGAQGTDWSTLAIVDPSGAGPGDLGNEQWGAGAGQLTASATMVAGWGRITRSDVAPVYPDIASEAAVPIRSDATCGTSTLDGGLGSLFSPVANLCAGVLSIPGPAKDSCFGDSGGPLIAWASADGDPTSGADNNDPTLSTDPSEWRQAGLVSGGYECGGPNYAQYARLDTYRSWIAANGTDLLGTASDVTALTATATSPSTVSLSWTNPVDPAASIRIHVLDRATRRYVAQLAPGASTHSLTGLHPDHEYLMAVTRTDGGGLSSAGAAAYILTPPDVVRPTNVQNVRLRPRRTAIRLRWLVPTDNVAVARIEVWARGPGAGLRTRRTYRRVARLGPTATGWYHRRLRPDRLYEYYIRVYDTSGNVSLNPEWIRYRTKTLR